MASYTTKTRLDTEEAIQRARQYFGDELGLELREEIGCYLQFIGGGGHVGVTIAEEEEEGVRTVDIETRDWDQAVREFIRRIH